MKTHSEKHLLVSTALYKDIFKQNVGTSSGENPFACKQYSKAFSLSGHLKGNMRTHSPNNCTLCPKAFSQAGNLKGHMRTHSGEKPFSCTQCSKTYSQAGNLNPRKTGVCEYLERPGGGCFSPPYRFSI